MFIVDYVKDEKNEQDLYNYYELIFFLFYIKFLDFKKRFKINLIRREDFYEWSYWKNNWYAFFD